MYCLLTIITFMYRYYTIIGTFLLLLGAINVSAQRISFLMDDFNAERWRSDSSNFYKEAVRLGAEVHIFQSDSDPKLQLAQAKLSIDSLKADVIVLVSTDKSQNVELLKYVESQKVPLILYERFVDGPHYQFLSFDSYAIGYKQAQHVIANRKGKNIILLNGPTFDNNAVLFRKGQMAALQPLIDKGEINVLLDIHLSEWTELEAFMRMNDFMIENSEPIHGIIAANDAIAKGAIDVLSMNGIENIAITGQDGTPDALENIKAKRQTYTIIKPTDILARETVQAALNASKGKSVESDDKTVFIPTVEVTLENVEEFVER